jgi:peptide/nickel transport system substrate-binding protein
MRFKLISLFLLTGLVFSSCSDPEETTENLVAKGGKKYGGEFKFMSTEKVNSLFPTFSGDVYSMRLISQIYESLLVVDPMSGKVSPGVAESFTVSDDAKVYTFKIRKGIKFHKDECFGEDSHELDAEDVKFSLDMACSGLKDNKIYYLLIDRIKGAKDFFDKSKSKLPKGGVSGIKVKDKHTVEITLTESFAGFEKVLTHRSLGIMPREAYDKYGKNAGTHPVGSGPFALESFSSDKVVLKRNPDYWRKDEFGNKLPFLSKVEMTYAKNKRSELMAFRKSEIDLVLELPVEEIEHILGTLQEAQAGKNVKHKVDSEMSMSMMFVALANESEEFSDVRVRKAFNMAIDRDEIIDVHLEGEGWAATNGFVPKVGDYPNDNVKGHKFNVEKARSLMSQAGYPNGKNFPKLDFYVNGIEGSSIHNASKAIANQLKKNLNVDLNIVLCTIDEREEAIASGKAKIWRSGWIADYPDAENFLTMFYGANIRDNASSLVNAFHYQNDQYDALFKKALVESDPDKRNALLVKCDQLIIDDAAVMPIMTDDHVVMINARVRDFKATPMEDLNITSVFIKEARK